MSFGLGLDLGLGSGSGGSSAFNPAALSQPLVLALVADAANVALNAGNVSQWNDTSGNGHHFTQATANIQPNFVASGGLGIHGKGSIRAVQTNSILSCVHMLTAMMTGTTSAERFILGQLDADAVQNAGGNNWGSAGQGSWLEYSDSTEYEEFGSTTRYNFAIPAGLMTSPFVHNAQSAAASYTVNINGVQRFTSGTNTFGAVRPAPTLFNNGSGASLSGQLRAIYVYGGILTPTERANMNTYLAAL